MRPMRNFTYLLSDEKGSFIAEVNSGVEVKSGDELNWKGNKLLVNAIEGDILTVKKIGFAILVK